MTSLNCRVRSTGELSARGQAQVEPWGHTHGATHLHGDVHEAKLTVEVRRGAKQQAHDGQERHGQAPH